MQIIVKKNQTHGFFKPHYSHSFGHYVHTKKEYLSEMKTRGLEPYNPNQPEKKFAPTKISDSGKEVINAIYEQTNKKGEFKPDGKLKNKLIKMGVIKSKSEVAKLEKKYRDIIAQGGMDQGGFEDDTKKSQPNRKGAH